MKRNQVKQAVEMFYKARLSNDPANCLACYADNATIEISGDVHKSDIATKVQGTTHLQTLIGAITQTWHWNKMEDIHLVIDGTNAAVRYMLETEHCPTKTCVTTQLMDHFVFNEQLKVVELTEFVDTALTQALADQ